ELSFFVKALFSRRFVAFLNIRGCANENKAGHGANPWWNDGDSLAIGGLHQYFFPRFAPNRKLYSTVVRGWVWNTDCFIPVMYRCADQLAQFWCQSGEGGNPAYCEVGGGGSFRTDRLFDGRTGRSVVGTRTAGDCGGNDQ